MKKWESEFHGTHGRDPRPEELADRLGTDVSVVHEVRDPCLDTMLSLERPLVDDGDSLHDILADPATRSPDETLEVVQRDRALMDALVELGGRDARILRLRYGIDDGGRDGRSLQAIGDLYGISRERVRQIESRALAGLRAILAGGDPG